MEEETQEVKIEYGPVLHPSTLEFSNFQDYIEKLENKYSKKYGLVKVVAPKSWVPRKQDYEKSIQKDMIPAPIEQNAYGKGGIYEMLHIVQKATSLKEYRKKAQAQDHVTQDLSIEEVEKLFYKNIAFSPPVYGADARNTLFDKGCNWNLGELKCLLNDGLTTLIQGVNEPFLYTGAWKTTFAWHKEDMDLGAINYLHDGKDKFWYAIANEDQHILEKEAQSHFGDNFNKCSEYLRHKTTIINPYILKKKHPNLKIHKMVQHPREFVIVFGGSYHHGFNFGYNIAEAVNYGTRNWLSVFLQAKTCKCVPEQVMINHMEFYQNIIQKDPTLKYSPHMKKFLTQLKQKGLYNPVKKSSIKINSNEEIEQEEPQKKQKKDKKSSQQNDEGQQQKVTKRNSMKALHKKLQNKITQLKNNKNNKQKEQDNQQQQSPLPIIKKKIQKQKTTSSINNNNKSEPKQQKQLLIKNSNVSSKAIVGLQNYVEDRKKYQLKRSDKAMGTRGSEDISVTRQNFSQQKLDIFNKKINSNLRLPNWLQCDNCSKFREIFTREQENKFCKKRSFYCKDITMKCSEMQDNKSLAKSL